MGRKPGKARITDSEARLLHHLWQMGPATVRDIHSKVSEDREVSYTAVLKTLQIMHEKGLVQRDESSRSHTYSAAEPEHTSKRTFVDQLLQKVFGGSKSQLRAMSQEKK
jgi:BlaI family transcriptional regulator, penicillinase repressor